jgi:hypothetical protein
MTKIARIRGDMPHSFTRWATAIATTALLVAAAYAPRIDAQAPGNRPARLQGKPNLSGIWQALNEANWDIQAHEARPGPPQFGAMFSEPAGLGIVDGNEIPYKPDALAKKKEHFANRWTRDPEAKCYMPGVPRATYQPFPFQIIQGTDKVLIAYRLRAPADRAPEGRGESPADSWMGWSRGRWEADTLVVSVTNLLEDTWFDRAGNFHSDALRVTERYTPAATTSSSTRRPSKTRTCSRVRGRCGCHSIDGWRRARSSSSSSACRLPRNCCTDICGSPRRS